MLKCPIHQRVRNKDEFFVTKDGESCICSKQDINQWKGILNGTIVNEIESETSEDEASHSEAITDREIRLGRNKVDQPIFDAGTKSVYDDPNL